MRKIFLIAFLFIFASVCFAQELPQTPDDPIKGLQYRFDGQWLPDVDPAKIGANNFKTLTNMRYNEQGIEGVKGFTRVNTTAITSAPTIQNGFHFRKDSPAESHILIHGDDAVVYDNTTAVPTAGTFLSSAAYTDASGAGFGRFAVAANGQVAYANGVESVIWGGDEMKASAFITSTAATTTDIAMTNPKDYSIEVNNDLTGADDIAIIGGGNDSSTVLLLHNDGADAEAVAIADSSTGGPTGNADTVGGNAQLDVIQAKFGQTSLLLDGTGDYVSWNDNAVWNFGASEFEIDTWVRFSAVTGKMCLYSQATAYGYVALFVDHDNSKLYFMATSTAGVGLVSESATWAPVINTWYHVAVVRGWGGVTDAWALVVDGTSVSTFTQVGTLPDIAAAIEVGDMVATSYLDFGSLTHGFSTSVNATIAAAALKWGTGGLSLDNGNNSQLFSASTTDFNPTTKWTVNFWVKHTDHAGSETYFFYREDDNNRIWLENIHGTGLYLEVKIGGVVQVAAIGAEIADANWHHIAICKVGDDWGVYDNGTQISYDSYTYASTLTGIARIGGTNAANFDLAGYVDDFQMVRFNSFSARPVVGLTDTITIPTAAHTPDGNEKLLFPFDLMGVAGWIDEFRISKGVSRWVANFDFPVRPYATSALYWLVGSTRPLQGVKFYVDEANAEASKMTAWEWDGNSWNGLSITDNTDTGASLATTGTVTWTSTVDTSATKFMEGRLFYWYQFNIDAGEATIYKCTVDAAMQPIVDIWDGVYRQPIQFQPYKSAIYVDYTLEVNDSDSTYYADLADLTSSEWVIAQFDERMTAVKFLIVAGTPNETAAIVTIYYWNGEGWATVGTVSDETLDDAGLDTSLSQSGVMSWTPPSIEQEFSREMFGSVGYTYKFVWDATLTTAKSQVNVVLGIPAQLPIMPFKFPATYKNRLMLCGYTEGGEGNRCDYSVTHAPQAFNGYESSMDGAQSLYFGGAEELTAGTEIYNRFGSNIFSMFLALKKTEIYLLSGSTPDATDSDPFRIFPISYNLGCPAPLTLATAEVGFKIAADVERNIAIWLSYSGPIIFDGAVPYIVHGIDKYFDVQGDDYLGASNIESATGWYDQSHKEYNLRISTKWFVYDLVRKRWFEQNVGAADPPECGFPVQDTNGTKYVYAGADSGFMLRLDNGDHWYQTEIVHTIETGDFWPSDNTWDLTRLYKSKFLWEGIETVDSVDITHYADASVTGTSLTSVLIGDMTNRITRDTQNTNLLGWTHRLKFVTTRDDGLIGYWPFDESAGTTAADACYDNDGTLEGTMTDADWVTGNIDNGIEFDNVDDRVDCGNSSPLDELGTSDFSVAFWVNCDGIGGSSQYNIAFSKWVDATDQIFISTYGGSQQLYLHLEKNNVQATNNWSDLLAFDATWHHVVVTVNRTTDLATAYMDGSASSSTLDLSSLPADISNAANVAWGNTHDGGGGTYELNGKIDEPRIYNRALTADEISALYTQSTNGNDKRFRPLGWAYKYGVERHDE